MLKTISELKFIYHANKQCLRLISHNPLQAILMLYKLHKLANTSSKAEACLNDIEIQLSDKFVYQLYLELMRLIKDEFYLIEWPLQHAVKALINEMLCNSNYLYHLRSDYIITISENAAYHRKAMIALIRLHLHERKLGDPFINSQFSYQLLNQAGVEHNYLYLSKYINQCRSIPFHEIVKTAHNVQLAKRILHEFSNTKFYYPMSVALLKVYPELANPIARQWRFRLSTIPLLQKERDYVARSLAELQRKYPVFRAIKLDARALRYHEFEINAPQKQEDWLDVLGAGLLGYAAPHALCHAQSILSLSAALFSGGSLTTAFGLYCSTSLPIVLPLSVYAGISHWRAATKT